ncbi:MAG: aminofutalosine synthase MqnE, partial [Nitrospinota bacterium]
DAGLGSIPGGGAEIFSTRVRREVCPDKISGAEWLYVMEQAHELGFKSNATMLYGHIETVEERVDHLIQLRELQDRTGGFLTFIPLAFHPQNTELSILSNSSGILDLKSIAISRLMLDNFPHVKAFWIMTGLKIAQIALSFGADDIDGTIIEEKITHAAGGTTEQSVSKEELLHLIRAAGRIPVERDTLYNILNVEDA